MSRVFRFVQAVIFHLATLLMLTRIVPAQDTLPNAGTEKPEVDPVIQRNIEDWAFQGRGFSDDWTHHYLVFSNPGTERQAIENDRYEQWLSIVNDPRFILQQIKRGVGAKLPEGTDVSPASTPSAEIFEVGVTNPGLGDLSNLIRAKHPLKKDWNLAIGGVAASGVGTVATNNASGTSTVTVDGQTLTGSATATAGGSGIFTGAPAPGQGVTITYGANVLNLTANGTASSVVGTVSGTPTSTVAPTITLTNSAGSSSNTLTLTTFANGATATGTFSGSGATSGQTITITNGTNTLTLTAMNGTYGTGTVDVNNANGAANGDTVTIGPVTYWFEETASPYSGQPFTGTQYYCPNTTIPCVWWGTSEANQTQAFYAAITITPSACPTVANGLYGTWQYTCYSYITAANPSVTATETYTYTPTNTGFVTVTNITGNAIPFSATSSQTAWALTPNTGSIPGYTSGTNGCTSATAGTFIVSTYPSTSATNLANAINACNSSYPAVGVTATATGNVVTITSTTLGSPASSLTLGSTASNFVWSAVTSGSSPTNGCTSATTGTFASGASTATVASNIAAAINACNSSYPAVGVTASYTSGSTFTVSGVAAGPYLAVGASNNTGLFTWGTLTAGTAGTNTCTSSTTGTFASSNNTTTLATNLKTAINDCPAAAGITANSTLATVILAARAAGSSGNSIALGTTMPYFQWAGADLSGGSDGTTSGTTFAYWSGAAAISTAQLAANIAAAINENTTLQGVVSATTNGSTVIVTANTPGTAGNSYGTTVANFAGFTWGGGTLSGGVAGAIVQPNLYPAMYSASFTTASCSDFVVYPTGTAGATGAASVVAFSNLYTGGCSGTVPSVNWAYNTGGMVTTSPVISLDGTQLMFVQVSGTTASLVLLKPANGGTPTLPVTPTAATLATYRSCTAPCMVTLAFTGNHNDSFSSPFYFYSGDLAFVGDDSGNLHQFTGVFNGTPAEAGGTWPLNLSGQKLSSPVFDPVSGHVIVGDFGGVLYSVTASSGALFGQTVSLGDVIADAPLLDSSAGTVYAFVTTANNSVSTSVVNDNAVYELPTNFTSITLPTLTTVEAVGTGGAGYYLYAGTFDNVYYSSTNATGNLYTVGNTGVTTGANLYRIPIAASVMGAPVPAVSSLTFAGAGATRPWPSPVEEFCNNGANNCVANATQTTAGTDYVFFSVNRGTPATCATAVGNGCVLSYNVSNPAAVTLSGSGLNVAAPNGNGCWPTGGIVIDNSVPSGTFAGASQIYFAGLGTNAAGGSTGSTSGNCAGGTASTISATQASQSNP